MSLLPRILVVLSLAQFVPAQHQLSANEDLSQVRSDDESLRHPGTENWMELGAGRHFSVYGYGIWTPYFVPHFEIGDLLIDQTRVSYFVFKSEILRLGPFVAFVPAGYAGTELDVLEGMSRAPYFQSGLNSQISLPFGQLEMSVHHPHHRGADQIGFRAALGTGAPILSVGKDRSWLNLQLETIYLPASTSNYLFGVLANEATASRNQFHSDSVWNRSIVLAHWLPLTHKIWLTMTFKKDWYTSNVVDSPIVQDDNEETYLFGILWAFWD